MAPSRMLVAALNLETSVQRAITQEQGSATDNTAIQGMINISWPRPGEVIHTGAYPGENGNMIFLGTQKNLYSLRRLQQNDEITLYDRKGNSFIYRIIAFSASGQPERVVDPSMDTWIFEPTQEAVLTIIVSMPQPLPPVNPDSDSSQNQTVLSRDDYTSSQKLAYRGVLALYAPAQQTTAATPVAVPGSVWETRPAPAQTPAPRPTVSSSATLPPETPPAQLNNGQATVVKKPEQAATPAIPEGLPDTGQGGAVQPAPTIILKPGPGSRKI